MMNLFLIAFLMGSLDNMPIFIRTVICLMICKFVVRFLLAENCVLFAQSNDDCSIFQENKQLL